MIGMFISQPHTYMSRWGIGSKKLREREEKGERNEGVGEWLEKREGL